MEQNRFAHGAFAPGVLVDDAPLLPNAALEAAPPPGGDDTEHAFASEEEETGYWQGVADGIRQSGGKVPPRLAARAAKGQLLVQVHDDAPPAPDRTPEHSPDDILDLNRPG